MGSGLQESGLRSVVTVGLRAFGRVAFVLSRGNVGRVALLKLHGAKSIVSAADEYLATLTLP